MGRKNKFLTLIFAAALLLLTLIPAAVAGYNDPPPPLFHFETTEITETIETTEPVEPVEISETAADGPDSDFPDLIDEWKSIYVDYIVSNSIILKIGSPRALIKSEVKQIDGNNPNVVPFIDENSRTLAPVRFIAENSGYFVNFEPLEKKITLFNFIESRQIYMTVGINAIFVNGETFVIDTVPIITPDERTFIPLRAFIEKGLNKNVAFVSSDQIIIISDIDIGGDDSELAKEAAEKVKGIFYNIPVYNDNAPVYNEPSGPAGVVESGEPVWPLDMSKVTRELKNWPAYMDGTYHAGTDFAVPLKSNVYSAYSGVVNTVRDLGNASYGKYIIVKSIINGKARYIYYAHLNEPAVEEGQTVRAGDKIGESGTTGNSEGPHLHYEVRNENRHYGSLDNPTLNPYDYLPKSK